MNASWNQKSLNLSMYGTLSRHIENKIQGQATEKYLPELGKGKVVETGGCLGSPYNALHVCRASVGGAYL